jgi:hypothetical protein
MMSLGRVIASSCRAVRLSTDEPREKNWDESPACDKWPSDAALASLLDEQIQSTESENQYRNRYCVDNKAPDRADVFAFVQVGKRRKEATLVLFQRQHSARLIDFHDGFDTRRRDG